MSANNENIQESQESQKLTINKPGSISDQELNFLIESVANSISLNTIELVKFKLTASQTIIFFEAINKNINITSLVFDYKFDTWQHYEIIFTKISSNPHLRELELNYTGGILFENIVKLFTALQENKSLITKLSLSFTPTSKNFTALVQYLESDHKLTNLNIEDSMNFGDLEDELCDRFFTAAKNLLTDIDINNLTAQQIQQLNLNNLTTLVINSSDEYEHDSSQQSNDEITTMIIDKLNLRTNLLPELTI